MQFFTVILFLTRSLPLTSYLIS